MKLHVEQRDRRVRQCLAIMHADDVGMIQLRQRRGFAIGSGGDFQRDDSADGSLTGKVDLGERAASGPPDDLKVVDHLAGVELGPVTDRRDDLVVQTHRSGQLTGQTTGQLTGRLDVRTRRRSQTRGVGIERRSQVLGLGDDFDRPLSNRPDAVVPLIEIRPAGSSRFQREGQVEFGQLQEHPLSQRPVALGVFGQKCQQVSWPVDGATILQPLQRGG